MSEEIRKKYRYFGNGYIEADDVLIKKFGQEYELKDQVVIDVLTNGGGILPSELFDQAGFTRAMIGDRRLRTPSNEEYMAAHRHAMTLAREHLAELTGAR